MTDTVTETHTVDLDSLNHQVEVLESLRYYRELLAECEAHIKSITAELAPILAKRSTYQAGGKQWIATRVVSTRRVLNLDKLRELDEDVYIDVTKRVEDKEAFDRYIMRGHMTSEIANEVVTWKESNPYILIKSCDVGDAVSA